MLISWPQCSQRRSSSNLLSNHRCSEYTGTFLFSVMNCINNNNNKSSVNILQITFFPSFLKTKPTSKQQAILYPDGVTSAEIFCFNCKNNLATGEEVSGENWSFGCSTKLFHKQFQEEKKKVRDFRKAVTYERNAYCLFTLRKRWRLKASVPSGNAPSTGFHRFPGK